MTDREETAHAVDNRRPLSLEETREKKQRVLTQGEPSVMPSIAEAVVIKDENVFFLAEPDGGVPLDTAHGYGLYFHDCRFLNGYEIRIAGAKPSALVSTSAEDFEAIFQLTNPPDIRIADGRLISKERVLQNWGFVRLKAVEGAAKA